MTWTLRIDTLFIVVHNPRLSLIYVEGLLGTGLGRTMKVDRP